MMLKDNSSTVGTDIDVNETSRDKKTSPSKNSLRDFSIF